MKKLMLTIGLLLVTGSAYAGVTYYTTVTEFYLDAFNDGSQTDWQDGYPYYARIGNGAGDVFVMCDSYLYGGKPGDMFKVYETNLGDSDLSKLRFINQQNGMMLYEEAGWLVWDTQNADKSNWTAMNQAVWYIFAPGSAPCPSGSACQYWLGQAESNYGNFPLNQVEVFTPVSSPNEQEFLCLWNGSSCPSVPPPVPEPGTFLLLGTGLLGWVGRRLLS